MKKAVEKRYRSRYGNHSIETEPGGVSTGMGGQTILKGAKFINFRPVFGSGFGELVTDDPEVQKTLEAHKLFGKKALEGEVWEDISYFPFEVTAKLVKEYREGLGWDHKETAEFLGYKTGGYIEAVEAGEFPIDEDFLKALRKKEFFEQEPAKQEAKKSEGGA